MRILAIACWFVLFVPMAALALVQNILHLADKAITRAYDAVSAPYWRWAHRHGWHGWRAKARRRP